MLRIEMKRSGEILSTWSLKDYISGSISLFKKKKKKKSGVLGLFGDSFMFNHGLINTGFFLYFGRSSLFFVKF